MAGFKTSSAFIASFQAHPVLYDANLKSYHSKAARRQALQEICKVSGLPEQSTHLITNKIKQLRSTFAKELRACMASQNSGYGRDFIQESTWKWYNQLKFLTPHVKVRCGRKNTEENKAEDIKYIVHVEDTSEEASEGATTHAKTSPSLCDTEDIVKTEPTEMAAADIMEASKSHPEFVTSHQKFVTSNQEFVTSPPSHTTPVSRKRPSQPSSPEPPKASMKTPITYESQWPETREILQIMMEAQQAKLNSKHYHFCMDMCQQLDQLSDERAMYARKEISDILFQFSVNSTDV